MSVPDDETPDAPKNGNGESEDMHLVITLHPNGNVSLNGPLANTMLCYGMLELARDAVRTFQVQRNMQAQEMMRRNEAAGVAALRGKITGAKLS